MNAVGQPEFTTQGKVIAFLRDTLGYIYLGNWKDRANNRNIEREFVEDWLASRGHDDNLIAKALFELEKAAALGGSKTLYGVNHDIYEMLRYGVKVQPDVGENNVTVWLIDWENPDNNHFSRWQRRSRSLAKTPNALTSFVYVNGIALGVLELKRSTVSVAEGIRQNLDNQRKEFIRPFFSTVQLVTAGNETEGLRYGVIETPEKHWLRWKEAGFHTGRWGQPAAQGIGPSILERPITRDHTPLHRLRCRRKESVSSQPIFWRESSTG